LRRLLGFTSSIGSIVAARGFSLGMGVGSFGAATRAGCALGSDGDMGAEVEFFGSATMGASCGVAAGVSFFRGGMGSATCGFGGGNGAVSSGTKSSGAVGNAGSSVGAGGGSSDGTSGGVSVVFIATGVA